MFRKRTHYISEEKTDHGAGQLESSLIIRYIWNSINWIMGSLLNSNDVDKNYTVIVTSGLLLNFLLLQKLLIKREFFKKEVNSPVILPPKYQSHHSGMMLLDHHHPPAKCTPAAGVPPREHGFSLLWQTSFHIATYQESRIFITAKQPTKWIHLH